MDEQYEEYMTQPDMVEVFPLDGETEVLLRRFISARRVDDGKGGDAICWACKERQFRIPDILSAEEIAVDFDAWWEYTPGVKVQRVEATRNDVLSQMSAAHQEVVAGGVDVTLSDGQTRHFSPTPEDLRGIPHLQRLLAFGAKSVLYPADSEECTRYSAADFALIADALTRWNLYQEGYFNSLCEYIFMLETVEEQRGVVYGMEIPEAYQTDVFRALLAQMKAADAAVE